MRNIILKFLTWKCYSFSLSLLFYFSLFLQHPWHMEVPGARIRSDVRSPAGDATRLPSPLGRSASSPMPSLPLTDHCTSAGKCIGRGRGEHPEERDRCSESFPAAASVPATLPTASLGP